MMIQSTRTRGIDVPTRYFTCYTLLTLPVVEMAHSSNAIIHGGTFNSAQGDFHIHNRDSESGMHDFKLIQNNIFVNDRMKDFIIWN